MTYVTNHDDPFHRFDISRRPSQAGFWSQVLITRRLTGERETINEPGTEDNPSARAMFALCVMQFVNREETTPDTVAIVPDTLGVALENDDMAAVLARLVWEGRLLATDADDPTSPVSVLRAPTDKPLRLNVPAQLLYSFACMTGGRTPAARRRA